MKKSLLGILAIALSILSCINKNNYKVEPLNYYKIIADAEEVSNSIFALSYMRKDSKPQLQYNEFSEHKSKIDKLLSELSEIKTGFKKNSLPINVSITLENENQVKLICEKLLIILQDIRIKAEPKKAEISFEQYSIGLTLTSNNPASYYDYINDSDSFIKLKDHELKDKIEKMSLQDISFAGYMAHRDESLWEMWKYSPNAKIIQLFGAELTNSHIDSLNFHKFKYLTVLVLAENNITKLPNSISTMSNLEYLDLRNNQIITLPIGLDKLEQLKFLNLKNNNLDDQEKNRLETALPRTKILF